MQAKIGLTGFDTEIFVWVALKHFSLGLSISTAIVFWAHWQVMINTGNL